MFGRRMTFSALRCLRLSNVRIKSSNIPKTCTWQTVDPASLPEVPKIDDQMIEHLERLSLVEFNNQAGVDRLHSAIQYANQLYMVDTDNVEPLDSVLEDRELYLREDRVTDGDRRAEVLASAVKTDEDYFVAPPGNIPLKAKDKDFLKKPDGG